MVAAFKIKIDLIEFDDNFDLFPDCAVPSSELTGER